MIDSVAGHLGGGWIGVDLFFVLSGFLVSGLLFREYQATGTVRPGRFLIRRAFKIYPPFYVLTFVALAVVGAPSTRDVLGELFFLQNYVGNPWGITWSLAVEEHFYLLLAGYVWCLVMLRPGRPFPTLPVVFVAVATLCLLLRVANADEPDAHFTHLIPTHLRIDSLMFGVLLSYGWHFGQLQSHARTRRGPLCVGGTLMLVPAFLFPLGTTPGLHVYGLTLFYLGSGALLIGLLSYELPQTRPVRLLAHIGVFSYSIYLYHWPIRGLARDVLLDVEWLAFAGSYLGGSILIGIAAAKLVEGPSLAIRDRYFPSQSRMCPAGGDNVRHVKGAEMAVGIRLPPPASATEGSTSWGDFCDSVRQARAGPLDLIHFVRRRESSHRHEQRNQRID